MKSLLIGLIATLAFIAFAQSPVKAQGKIAVSKITSTTTAGGSVLFETSGTLTNARSKSKAKSQLEVDTYGFTGGTVWIRDAISKEVIFRGPVSGITIVPTQASDSLKILFLRQYLTNQ